MVRPGVRFPLPAPMSKIITWIILILVISGIGTYLLFKNNQKTLDSSETAIENSESSVTIEDFGFITATITIKKGATITWTNKDSVNHMVASNPHPVHTDLPGFESQILAPGESYSFTFDKVGTFGYHCHLHPSMRGTVIVTE